MIGLEIIVGKIVLINKNNKTMIVVIDFNKNDIKYSAAKLS